MLLNLSRMVALAFLPLAINFAVDNKCLGQAVDSEKTASAERTSEMSAIETPKVEITAAESASHGLPPAEITLDTGKFRMWGSKLSMKDEYLRLSGPPGGPLGLIVKRVAKAPKDTADWKAYIEENFKDRFPETGSIGKLEIDGEPRAAFTCTTDKSMARSHHLLILFAVPKSEEGVIVEFYSGADETKTPSPEEMAKQDKFKEISRSLSIKFE